MSFTDSIYKHSPVFFQNVLTSAYGWQWKRRRFGGVFPQEYEAAKEREKFTTTEWQNYQQDQLQRILRHAFEKVPYYKEAFRSAGIDKTVLEKIEVNSLSLLPVLTKQQLRLHGTGLLLATDREKQGAFFASSGSTGTPTQILFSVPMHQRWMALFESRVRNWAGVSSAIPRGMIGGRRVVPGSTGKPPFYRYNHFEKQVYFSAYHINKANAGNYVDGMLKHGVQYMTGYAMSNFFLAQFIKEAGLQAPQLHAVITSSEKLTEPMRQIFTEVYGCKTFDGWSGVEACALVTECAHGSLHISPDAGLIELLDKQMQPVSPGEAGDVYCTGFINYDQPLIRYAIGDQMVMGDERCSCGRDMPVIKEILGRVEDVVRGRDGRKMVRFHSVFNGVHAVKAAQVIQESVDRIRVKLVTEKGLSADDRLVISSRIVSQLGDIEVILEEVNEIPLNANGKFQAVISKVR